MAYTLNKELGYVYDTMRFFTMYPQLEGNYPAVFLKLNRCLTESGVKIEKYLLPFYHPQKNELSWFTSLFQQRHEDMTMGKVKTILGNRHYLMGKLLEYYFPKASNAELAILKSPSEPPIFEMMNKYVMNPEIELYLFYILNYFDVTVDVFRNTVISVYKVVQNLHHSFYLEENSFIRALNERGMMDKLTAIAGIKSDSHLSCALSLFSPECISYSPMKPQSFILGVDFKRQVDIKYKYSHVTPYSLAKAIGNPAKYEIFNIFLQHHPTAITSTDIALQYQASRNALAYSIKDMLNSGIIKIDHIHGKAHYYKLDMDYIKFIGEKILSLCQ